jgi:hypothetical protein
LNANVQTKPLKIQIRNIQLLEVYYDCIYVMGITDPAIYILTYNKNSGMIGEWKSKTAGS